MHTIGGIMEDNNKICTCTTPEYTINLNKQGPPGVKGDTGENGFSPVITVAQNTPASYILNILTVDGMTTTPNLKANLPAGGATGQVLTKNSGTQDDCSWQNLPNATVEVEGIARLATETDFETTEDSAVSDTSIVTPALFNSEFKAQVGNYIVAGDNISTSVGEDGKVTINSTAEPFTLPQATATALGGIKVGENLSITEDGILSATGGEVPSNMMTVDTNQDVTGQKTFRNGIFVGYEGSPAGYVTFGRNNVTFAKGTAVSIGVINPDTTGDMDLYLGQNALKWNNINAVITGTFNINGSQVLTLDTLPQATSSVLGGIKANEKDDTDTQEVKIDPATGLLYTQPGSVPNIIDGGNANTVSVIPQPIDRYTSNNAIVNSGYTTTETITVEDEE